MQSSSVKISLKKEKNGYMTYIPICGPHGSINLGNTSNDTHNTYLQERHSKLLKNYVGVPFNKKESLQGYTDDEGIFGIIRRCQGLR